MAATVARTGPAGRHARRRRASPTAIALTVLALVLTACSSGSSTGASPSSAPDAAIAGSTPGRPVVVVSTPLVGALVRSVGGDQVDVRVALPAGADPAGTPDDAVATALDAADLLVVIDPRTYETALASLAADADDVLALAPQLNPIPLGGSELEPGSSDATGATDPHVWLDPDRWTQAARLVGAAIAELDGVDASAVERNVAAFDESLGRTDETVQATYAVVPEDRRVLVSDLPALGYLADRYGFDLLLASDPTALARAATGRGVTVVLTAPDRVDALASSLATIAPELHVVGLDLDATTLDGAPPDLATATAASIELLIGAADTIAAAVAT